MSWVQTYRERLFLFVDVNPEVTSVPKAGNPLETGFFEALGIVVKKLAKTLIESHSFFENLNPFRIKRLRFYFRHEHSQ